jgi:hypothetical protein
MMQQMTRAQIPVNRVRRLAEVDVVMEGLVKRKPGKDSGEQNSRGTQAKNEQRGRP